MRWHLRDWKRRFLQITREEDGMPCCRVVEALCGERRRCTAGWHGFDLRFGFLRGLLMCGRLGLWDVVGCAPLLVDGVGLWGVLRELR